MRTCLLRRTDWTASRSGFRSGFRSDEGVSLIELLVTMVLLSLALGMFTTWFIGMQRSATGYSARIADLGDARLAVDAMTKDVRMAISPTAATSPFLPTTSSSRLDLYVNRPTGLPDLVTYRFAAEPAGTVQLVRTVTPGLAAPAGSPAGTMPTWPAAGARTQVLVRGLPAASAGSPFTFYDQQGATQPPCGGSATTGCASPISVADALAGPDVVGAVGIDLVVAGRPELAKGTEVVSRVRLVNAGASADVAGAGR
ncbi:MAG: PilW family protein [Motilibacteraceae bacterium]